MRRKWRQTICGICCVLLLLVGTDAFSQERQREEGLSLSALQQMPLSRFEKLPGEMYVQRNLSDVKRIVGYVAGTAETFSEEEQEWIAYLEKPHPSVSTMQKYFQDAAQEFEVPVELLEAIGQVESNWTQMGPSVDQGWGVMHLVQNSYADTLNEAAQLLDVSPQVLKDDARQNIRAAAALLASYAGETRSSFTSVEDWFHTVKQFSALDGDALQTLQAERYFEVLRDGITKPTLWNEQIQLQAHPNVSLKTAQQSEPLPVGSSDYGAARSSLYSSCTYTPGRSRNIDTWVNHWIGSGTYAGAISYLRRCDVKASAHFVIKQNGEITQTVRVRDTAWHAGARGYPNNSRSIGVEHEAVVADPSSWNHTAMLKASAQMARYFAEKYGIPKKRALPGIRGHNEMPGTHTQCPGNLPWSTWMNYFNGSSPANPKLTKGISVYTNNPSSQPIEYGQYMAASIKVKNFGGKSMTFRRIGIGGRAPKTNGGNYDDRVVYEFPFAENVTLKAGQEREFSFHLDHFGYNGIWGTYHFWACYQLADGSWHPIPTGASGTRSEYNFKVVKHASPARVSNGVGKAGFVPRKGYDQYYLDVPDMTTSLTISVTGGRSGNYLNLYERAGTNYPTTGSYDHKSSGSSSNERITIQNPAAGRHTIFVDGYYASGSERGTPYTITATWQNPTTPTPKSLTLKSDPGTPIEGLNHGAVAAWLSPYWNQSLVNSPTGTSWIWSSYHTTDSENHYGATRTFLEPFTIPQGAKHLTGSIDISADDRFRVVLNGKTIAENGDHRYVRHYTFTPRVGQNVLKISGINAPGETDPSRNAAGVIYRATITYDQTHALDVVKEGNGSGTVSGIGIRCGDDCREEYGDNAKVTLSAEPAHGAVFTGWAGACDGTGDCTLTMNEAKTVKAAFTLHTHTISASADQHGTISPAGQVPVDHGSAQTFTITPEAGYQVAAILVDGKTVNNAPAYTFANVTADHSLKVYFKKAVHTITSHAGTGGKISPEGGVLVTDGANQAFTMIPDTGYRVQGVEVDGVSVGTIPRYTFSNVHVDHAITATFEKIPAEAVRLTIEDSQAKPGATNVPVEICLENAETTVNSMQFRVRCDASKGIHAVGGSSGYRLTERTQGFSASVTLQGSGVNSEILVLLYNLSEASIATGSGPVMELLFNVDAAAKPDDTIPLTFTESVVSDAAAQSIPSVSTDTALFTILQPYELGDINADGSINVLDLQLLINAIQTNSSCERGDMNGDGLYNVLDVQLLINIINQMPPTTPTSTGQSALDGSGTNTLTLPNLELQPAANGVFGVELVNEDRVAAGQFTLMYDSTTGFEITGVNLTSRTNGFYTPVSIVKDERDPANVKVDVLFFSLDGKVIEPGVGDILEFSYQTSPEASGNISLAITEALFVTQAGQPLPSPVMPDNGEVIFEDPSLLTITVESNEGGTIEPDGMVRVQAGDDQMFLITAAEGYHVKDVLVDNISEGAISRYSFSNVNADHVLVVEFASDAETTSSFFGFDEFGGFWSDAEKSLENPDDDWMCWAAAAANILDWTGWGTEIFDTAQEIFTHFQDSWTNAGGLMEYGWQWWFDGSEPPAQQGWAELNDGWADTEFGGGYWNSSNFFESFAEDWAWDASCAQWGDGSGLMTAVDQYLHEGYGTTLAVYNESGGHALTAWGYEYDDAGAYTGLWVTDSDDYDEELKLLSVSLDPVSQLWYLDPDNLYDYDGWFLGGVQALAQNPGGAVPEPGTVGLFGLGLFVGLILRSRKTRAARK